MRRLARFTLLSLLFACTGAFAQSAPKTKPYEIVQASFDRSPASDPALGAVIERLRGAVRDHTLAPVEAMLSSSYVALSCSADPTAPCAPGQAKAIAGTQSKAAERMRSALCCEGEPSPDVPKQDQEETIIGFFATVLEDSSIGAHPEVPGSACLPALAKFDRVKAGKAAKAANIDADNLRVAASPLQLREKPAPDSAIVQEVKPGDLLPVLGEVAMSVPAGWNGVALAKGGIGFTDQVGINELTPPAVCFTKTTAGQWQIAFTIQRGG